ncbi:hypothetical protein KIN20_020103 [Parelaphostrongylus tenuis]|uniref:MARVEL domain-containing protein n=1 Tax=Parelaphostrongylus tenuis TaxID=148309 RepID=A0AAD5MQL1_PARTN|nr:hypothetical protein KIN20_020103 [Parelaphostrongylus tenuis]
MARPLTWLLSPLPILKFCQMVCLLLVVVFLIDGRIQWKMYSVIYALAFLLIFGCVVTLILHYYEIQKTATQVPWIKLELLWNGIGLTLCSLGCAVLMWDWWQLRNGHRQHHNALTPHNIGEIRWQRRVLIVTGSLLLSACLFLCTLIRVRRTGI